LTSSRSPHHPLRIAGWDDHTLTVLPPLTIAQVYEKRWDVELFFGWVEMHFRIKAFYGTSENAVKTRIWIAVSVCVLVAILRKRLGLTASLCQLLQILSMTLFEKTPISRYFREMTPGMGYTAPATN